ncbi:hypothetical protein [Roseiterribacter gracilis]|uniref:Uncharacterized protein n=1 Tax=Roseiterribacter gracilis TaxID=2812848 RepID=A0A8S8XC86_9PROT|nr:hypothetical protein TMPK1_33000 [Rhodospirillales bacterium TMPK1]
MLDEATRRFLRRHIRSVWTLDALLTLKRDSARSWTAETLTAELRAARPMVTEILAAFRTARLVEETSDGSRYAPADSADDKAVDTLARLYAERPTALIREIMAAPSDRLQGFADAFRLKKD